MRRTAGVSTGFGAADAAAPPTMATTSPTFATTPAPTRISLETARDDRLDFERHLVGLDLEEVVAFLDLVADGLEPVEDFPLGDGFAELRHDDGFCHRTNRS